ncbi:PPP2R1A-PPP2R2A-interacting phosphatase regulator 1 [Harmonia axyridis]|uniref:PPP2R1A-PPP2R2A-interacting phosphatase regulator 1 n=1 Tax=Harmonia axyridis TaxID=115357 RepID=UPI001E276F53|nr:PPP2R1A-PPP2R2A-interacting phosphatase regulator 1 [Harmonia axyridis]
MSSPNTPVVDMDVDGPTNGPGTLKRCSSAPMINEGNAVMATAPPTTSTIREPSHNIFGASQTRTRRFSASFSPLTGSPVSALRLAPRISQLRQEEHADISNSRELAHEREIQHTIQISQSWEDLSLMGDSTGENKAKLTPLHVSLGSFNPHHSSPSPTRLYSPNFQSPTRASRTLIRRSASPVLKPSPLGVKRKLDEEKVDFYSSPKAKRFHSFTPVERGGLLTTTAPSLPGSLSSVGTPESFSSADSPSFNFRNVDSPSPSRAMNVESSVEPMVLSKNDHDMADSPS